MHSLPCAAGAAARAPAPLRAAAAAAARAAPRRAAVAAAAAAPDAPAAGADTSAAGVTAEEDLWQHAGREEWYLPKFGAADAPDWNPATFLRARQLAPGLREVVLAVEASRERVPLRNAHRHVGQRARVRVAGGAAAELPVASAPLDADLLRDGLLQLRGDMIAEAIKKATEEGSVRAEVTLLVREGEASDIYAAAEGDALEAGPFAGTGLDLRGPVAAIFQCPTLVFFIEGDGIAAARALATASPSVGGLSLKLRRGGARAYYRAPNAAALCYADEFARWEADYGLKVITSTRDSFAEMFDDDDTLEYDPTATAAILLCGGDEEAEAAAAEVAKEAEITIVVRQSVEQPAAVYLRKGTGEAEQF